MTVTTAVLVGLLGTLLSLAVAWGTLAFATRRGPARSPRAARPRVRPRTA